jgi:hypothetical protein
VKSLPLTSAQSRSGGGGGIQKSGYDGSQFRAGGRVVAGRGRRVVVVAGLGRCVVAVVAATVVVVADWRDLL